MDHDFEELFCMHQSIISNSVTTSQKLTYTYMFEMNYTVIGILYANDKRYTKQKSFVNCESFPITATTYLQYR